MSYEFNGTQITRIGLMTTERKYKSAIICNIRVIRVPSINLHTLDSTSDG